MAALLEALEPRSSDIALDVATGTGFTAIALASRVKLVTGIDVTEKMLEQSRQLARSQSVFNATFKLGDAMKMDFSEESFDLVTTRRAAHHFDSVPRFLREAKRVLKAGGRIGIVDMSPPEGAESFTNTIEKLRDGSHVKAFTPAAWASMVMKAGFSKPTIRTLDERLTFEKWLYPVGLGGMEEETIRSAWKTAPKSVRNLLEAEFYGDTIRSWVKSRLVLTASKTP